MTALALQHPRELTADRAAQLLETTGATLKPADLSTAVNALLERIDAYSWTLERDPGNLVADAQVRRQLKKAADALETAIHALQTGPYPPMDWVHAAAIRHRPAVGMQPKYTETELLFWHARISEARADRYLRGHSPPVSMEQVGAVFARYDLESIGKKGGSSKS